MDVLLELSDELVPQNLNVCGTEFGQNNFMEVPTGPNQPSFLYSKMSRGTCLVIFGVIVLFVKGIRFDWSCLDKGNVIWTFERSELVEN